MANRKVKSSGPSARLTPRFDYLAKGESVTLTYTIELDDKDGGVTTTQLPITITGTNDRP